MPKRPRKKPRCKALLLCESATTDKSSGLMTLRGLFSQFNISRFPTVLTFCVFLQLFDGMPGEYAVDIEVQDLDNGDTLYRFPGPIARFTCRREKLDVMIQMPEMLIDVPSGLFAVVAFADGQYIADQTFAVRAAGESA